MNFLRITFFAISLGITIPLLSMKDSAEKPATSPDEPKNAYLPVYQRVNKTCLSEWEESDSFKRDLEVIASLDWAEEEDEKDGSPIFTSTLGKTRVVLNSLGKKKDDGDKGFLSIGSEVYYLDDIPGNQFYYLLTNRDDTASFGSYRAKSNMTFEIAVKALLEVIKDNKKTS